ncbi:hypothetical protein [Streptomyces sp. NPDC097619]|uniref:hypothetical protein n=1 Tax=Streptomyces sp. NPDC097619 TaxID=3157228 RepID=UPI003319B852
MSQESVPEHPGQAAHDHVRQEIPAPAPSGQPKGLLQQMEELMAALNADLSQLDADLQSSAERPASDTRPLGGHTTGAESPAYRGF